MVKHKINDHARNRHVEPKRKCDSRDAAMTREILAQSAIQSNDDEGDDHDRENRVRHEDREIDRAHNAGALKTRGAVMVVIDQIRGEKQCGDNERRDLARAMGGDISRPDE